MRNAHGIGVAVLVTAVFALVACGGGGSKQETTGHPRNVAHEFLSEKKEIEFSAGFEDLPAQTLTFHDLREYPLEGDSAPPGHLMNLHNRKISINGFVIPLGPADMSYFSLAKVPFNECYFCYPPSANEQVIVYNARPPEFNVLKTPIRVTGRLEVGKTVDRNGFMTLYRMDAYSLEPIPEEALPPETRRELEDIRASVREIKKLQQTLLQSSAGQKAAGK